ncbi:Hypothetical protein CINCED_3A008176 [Cinara cedri]|uniref:Uncharacterized protein n=1 Tax=Cinara cedri TaxID=506608 RepID=A0A5E4MUM0_9HEMI|nr:Hypothetical protein CINCED_3A008176 [Cinara cedri]
MFPVRRRATIKGCGLINTLINKLPVELHLPADRNKTDYILENRAWERFKAKDVGYREKTAAWVETSGMRAKRKLGAGCGFKDAVKAAKKVLKKNVCDKNVCTLTRKCIAAGVIPIPKSGGMLQLIPIFAGLPALSSLAGGAASVAKAIGEFNRTKPTHLGNGLYLTPHKGSKYKITGGEGLFLGSYKNTHGEGLFLAPHKKNIRGEGLYLNPHKGREAKKSAKKKKKLITTLPDRALYDYEIIKYANAMKIPHFRSVFSRDRLPFAPKQTECAVINLGRENSKGTHWVAYKKFGKIVD